MNWIGAGKKHKGFKLGKAKRKRKEKIVVNHPRKGWDMKPSLILDKKVHQKIMHWVHKAPGEISGFGMVQVIDGIPRITDAFLCEQKNSGASTEMDAEDILKAMTMAENLPGEMRWWWHSHADMGVFWSGTDLDTIYDLGHAGWCFSTVFNKKGETRSAFFGMVPVHSFADEIRLIINEPVAEEEKASWDKEYDEKAKPIHRYPMYPSTIGTYPLSAERDDVETDQYGNRWRWSQDHGWTHAGTVDRGYGHKDDKQTQLYFQMREEREAQLINKLRSSGIPECDIIVEVERQMAAEGL